MKEALQAPQGQIRQWTVVKCRYCGAISLIQDVIFRCPECKVFLDGPIAIATVYPDQQIEFEETGENYSYKTEIKKTKVSTWDVLGSHGGPVSLLSQNRNWLAVVCGPTGTGKSYTSIRLCEMLDKNFKISNIAFDIPTLIDLFEKGRAGTFLMFDEGNEWSSRESLKKENVMFSKILSMLRFTQISVLFTLPHLAMIDINGRRVMHSYLYSIIVNRQRCPPWQKNMSGVYWYNIIPTRLPKSGSTDIPLLYKFPVVNEERISKVWFKRASEGLLKEYEEIKKQNWNKKLVNAKKMGNKLGDMDYESINQRIDKVTEAKEKKIKEQKKSSPAPQLTSVEDLLGTEG